MPNKTIYVRDADVDLFDKAEALGGGNLSATIAEALRGFVAAEEAKENGRRRGYAELLDRDFEEVKNDALGEY